MIKKNQKQLTEVFIVELKQQHFSLFLFSTLWLCFCLPKWPKYFLDPFCGCYFFIEATECDFFSLSAVRLEVISLWLISSHTFLNFFPKSLWHSSHAFGFLNRMVMLCASKMCSFKFEVLVVWETLLSSGNNICSRHFLMLLLCVLLHSVDLNLLSFSQQSVFAVSALLSLFIATSPITAFLLWELEFEMNSSFPI